jgi:hypothetical protein
MAITVNKTLYSIDTITPLEDTDYIYSYSAGTNPLTNNQVRIICNTVNGEANIYLPPIASFNGIYDINIFIFWADGLKAKLLNIHPSMDSLDTINYNPIGGYITPLHSPIVNFTIGYEGLWIGSSIGDLASDI